MKELLVSEGVRDWLVHGGCADEIGGGGGGGAVGLLVGAFGGGGVVRVLHVSLTRDEEGGGVVPLSSVSGSLVGHHAKQLLRMLPGGLNIVGVVVVHGGGDVFKGDKVGVVVGGLARQMGKRSAKWYGCHGDRERVVVHFDPKGGNKFQARSFLLGEVVVGGGGNNLKPLGGGGVVFAEGVAEGMVKVETKFECHAWVARGGDAGKTSGGGLKDDFFKVLQEWEGVLRSSAVLVDGKVPSEEDVVGCYDEEEEEEEEESEEVAEEEEGEEERSRPWVSILVDRVPRVVPSGGGGGDFVSHVNVSGVVHAVCFVEKGATTAEVKRCVEEDILRSLVSRLEMHCESLIDGDDLHDDVDGQGGQGMGLGIGGCRRGGEEGQRSSNGGDRNKVYHELPRRVFAGLVGAVEVCDYLFPGEGAKDSVTSLKEVVGVKRAEHDIQTDREVPFDLEELDHLKGSMEELLSRAESISKIPADLGVLVSSRKSAVLVAALFAVAALVLLAAVAIPIFRNRN